MPAPDLDSKLRALVDRSEIVDCLTRYCRGIDRQDRELVRSAYHDDAIDDHIGFVGGVDDFIDWAFDFHATQVRHQHYVTNHTIELDGDTAHVETYYFFIATMTDDATPLSATGGRYVDRFERRDDRWAIAARLCVVEWMTELPSLLDGPAVEFLTIAGTMSRDRSDASYQRPFVLERAAEVTG
jgi:hypothetical protein